MYHCTNIYAELNICVYIHLCRVSGVVLIAKTRPELSRLSKEFETRQVRLLGQCFVCIYSVCIYRGPHLRTTLDMCSDIVN